MAQMTVYGVDFSFPTFSMYQEARPENSIQKEISMAKLKKQSIEQAYKDDRRAVFGKDNSFTPSAYKSILGKYILTDGPSGAIKGTVKEFYSQESADIFLKKHEEQLDNTQE